MKSGGIEICAVWPNESLYLRIELHPLEEVWFSQRTVELTPKHGQEVDSSC